MNTATGIIAGLRLATALAGNVHAAEVTNVQPEITGVTIVEFSSEDTTHGRLATNVLKEEGPWQSGTLPPQDVVSKPLPTGDEKRVDNPVDMWMLAQTGPAGKPVKGNYSRRFQLLDTTDFKQGDFSVVFTVGKADDPQAVGFYSGDFIDYWAPGGDFKLYLWLKASAGAEAWPLAIYDKDGVRAEVNLDKMAGDGKWREFKIARDDFKAEGDFNFNAIRSVQLEAALPEGAQVWMDDLYFRHKDRLLSRAEILGVTDKTITQYMSEAEKTRPKRVEAALPRGTWAPGQGEAAALYAGRDLEETNRKLIEWFRKDVKDANGDWSLHTSTALNMLYFGFGSDGKIKPGRLSAEAEAKLLEFYWEHCLYKNDIATARRSTWVVAGSENHDVNFKVANLLSSWMFMRHPDYRKRVYPDLGRMAGYGYGAGLFYGEAGQLKPLGTGDFSDGKTYRAEEHYQAWVGFWKEWFAERAKHGFFIEHNAGGYMKYTNKFIHDIYAWCEDEELRRQCRMFMDLVWAQWAQDQVLTIQGGAATRGHPGVGAMSDLAVFLMGGPGNTSHGYFQLFSDYQWPRQVWEMMLDRRGKGEYAYVSRKPNEEQDVWPRPAGAEYSMLIRPDSRLARYSWVTPDYVMGTRMDHPAAMYCHLSGASQGIIFATSPNAIIRFGSGYYRAVQERNVMVFQGKKSWLSRHPDWFPGWTAQPGKAGVSFGEDLDRIEEKDGWIFVEEGNAYAAIRIIKPAPREKDQPLAHNDEGFAVFDAAIDSYTWNDKKNEVTSTDDLTPMIVEASRRGHHATLEAFQQDILDNPLQLRQIIGGYVLDYTGCGKNGPSIEFNAANNAIPKVDGKHLDYNCPTFSSPWLNGAAGSGVVTLTGPVSDEKLVLDFNKIERRSQ